MAKMKTGTKILIGTGVGLGTIYGISVYSRFLLRTAMVTPPSYSILPPTTFSIIIKNLNEEAYISRCIESLLNQSIIKRHPEYFEILLVDGSSNDNSIRIAKRYPSVKIVVTKRGILNQLNVGIEKSRGDIIVFTDSDSEYPQYWLEKLVAGFMDDDVVMVHTSFLINDAFELFLTLRMWLKNFVLSSLGGGQAIRRWVFEETGLFDVTYDCVNFHRVRQEEELNLIMRASSLGRIVYQYENPFITSARRIYVQELKHECVRNPKSVDCPYAMDVGISRF